MLAVSNVWGSAMRFWLSLLAVLTLAPAAPAWGQWLTGRFSPEKQRYLVQEPIVVQLELTNKSQQTVTIEESSSCGFEPSFEVPDAEPAERTSLWGCSGGGYVGSCLGALIELRPGQRFEKRYLLKGPFRSIYPGLYHVRAVYSHAVYDQGQVVATQEIESDFVISLEPGTPSELAAVYEPFLRALKSPDWELKGLALEAVTQNPPPFLEPVVLRLADDPGTAAASIAGLKRPASPAAKAKLAELSSGKHPEWIRGAAVEALGELDNPAYCQLMLNIARESPSLPQVPLLAAGRLCGSKAVPAVVGVLAGADNSQRFAAAYALGNTNSRAAVAVLIALLGDASADVRRAAADALATLTHRRSAASVRDDQSARGARFDWAGWWALHSPTAPIYSPSQCAPPQPID
jgi:HEAT repeats